MEESKGPKVCNHCQGTDIMFHVWGRLEYYSCKGCKQEVKETIQNPTDWGVWEPKMYGFGTTDLSIPLPSGMSIDLDAFHGNDSSDDGDWL